MAKQRKLAKLDEAEFNRYIASAVRRLDIVDEKQRVFLIALYVPSALRSIKILLIFLLYLTKSAFFNDASISSIAFSERREVFGIRIDEVAAIFDLRLKSKMP